MQQDHATPADRESPPRAFEFVVLIVLAVAPFLTVLDGPFLYDDTTYVANNHQVTEPGFWAQSFTSSYPPGKREQGLYRPVVICSYALDHAIAGLSPWLFHLTNLLLHAMATIAAFLLVRGWLPRVAFWAAVLFAVHPAHIESVSWIVGRAELLCGLFLFACLWLVPRHLPWAAVALVLALLSKEMAITAPVLAVLPAVFLGASRRTAVRAAVVFAIVLLAYLIVRATVLGALTPQGNERLLAGMGLLDRVPAMGVAFGEYLRLGFLPVHLSVDYHWPTLPGFGDGAAWFGCLGLIAVVVAAIRWRRRWPWVGFTAAWFVVALGPVSHVFPIGASYAERFLYIPSIAACIVIASLLHAMPSRRVATITLLCLVTLAVVRIVTRNEVWRDEERFYSLAIEASPRNPVLHNNFGRILMDRNQLVEAERRFDAALAIKPEHAAALGNLGIIRARQRRFDEARSLMERALRADPSNAGGYFNLGRLHAIQNRRGAAIQALEHALELRPGYPQARALLERLRRGG